MIPRNKLKYLDTWRTKPHRKPLVLRGARQVGKSSLIREFAKQHFKNLAEINLEKHPEDAELILRSKGPADSLKFLSARLGLEIKPGNTLLFFDEIQARPDLFANLRYWHEELPELHVVAAGSLLDLTLSASTYSVPVGRIEYCHIGPLTFTEFLTALGDEKAAMLIKSFKWGEPWPDSIHHNLLRRLKQYWIVGGMPEAASVFARNDSFNDAEEVKRSITNTYRDDFAKYGGRVNQQLLRRVYQRVPTLVGKRAKYVEYDRETTSVQISKALDLLTLAQVISRIRNTTGTGIPLGADADDRLCKYLFVDVGLQLSLCDLNPLQIERAEDLLLVNRGGLAEQFIGQHLLYLRPPYHQPELYYWERMQRNASAELDYLVAINGEVVPVEIKSGAGGKMRSLQVFLNQRPCPVAVRFSTMPPKIEAINSNVKLLSLPLYFVEEVERLVSEAMGTPLSGSLR